MAPAPGGVEPDVTIPVFARVHLAHAVVQHIAEECGVDLLHLKGPALLPGLRPPGRKSTDVDVLVRPSHFDRLQEGLRTRGWEPVTQLGTGSAFGHAANWWHPHWGYADLHAHWPGATVSPEATFAALSEGSFGHPIAHVPCPVPSRTGQILVLLLHAARSAGSTDPEHAWHAQSFEQRAAVSALAVRLGAEVALASALGDLDAHRGDRSYALWRFYREGGGRIDEWRARYRAADSSSARLRLVGSAARVNRDYLALQLGHVPSRAEVRRAQLARIVKLGREAVRALMSPFRTPRR